ncbi:S1 family peptidase [Asanoa sp. NPDC049518]|uniref:S1 family peptidase n=1 Tax=unclassified Asanoa TaxID=2685164 RepID=UPI0034267465
MRVTRILAAAVASVAVLLPASTAAAAPGLDRYRSLPGTAWWTDAAGATVVAVDETVPSTAAAGLEAALRGRGHLVREKGTLRRHIAGADQFFQAGGFRCLIGFNARAGSTYYFLTSRHCVGSVGGTVYADAAATVPLGVVSVVTPGQDTALIRYTNTTIAKPSAVNTYPGLAPIRSFGSSAIGSRVTRSGPNGVRSGTVTALNVTVNYADGTVTGLIRTNICGQPGDSGGPLFAGTVGVGITSGGSGSCTTGGVSYYASAARAGSAYGVGPY